LLRKPNTDGWGNKLVTIFARHLDSFIVTLNFSLICQIRDFGSGQILQPRQFYLSPGLAKIAPWWLARRDYFMAKVPGLVSADGATNVYSLNRRAVRLHGIQKHHSRDRLTFLLNKIKNHEKDNNRTNYFDSNTIC
jgi:hypothetical protein